ncbi:cysteine desulfurase/selenocysteine lyase [Methylomarinovum caldicuralii]|uniref:Cysteine desulfurase n=1 Tax=Methylomarinovum caldicuralii TaxID=438856 RepID=A0AAU9BSR3_9GAMM|nr:cysteine desulfurase [Methylomarinovum caldicuralii]BCX81611.1 cysteine desulfurase/selenocysteine lyase [Methylomarinovum caldicuralii]
MSAYPIDRIRADFPILAQQVRGKPLVYLDNAASAQKPNAVIDTLADFYRRDFANIHRSVHTLGERATARYEAARETVRQFLNAEAVEEIVFVRGTTEAINLVAQSWGHSNLKEGDEILITAMEHHSNIVPWQLVCQQTGAVLKVAPIDTHGELLLEAFERLLTARTKLVAVTHMSNALGTINPVERLIDMAHAHGAKVLVDGAQAVPHLAVDVQALGCDFYAFSGHKVYGPTGIGALYGRRGLLEAMPPWQGGGEMIRTVTFEKTEYADPPYKFEAGTPAIAEAVGLAAAIEYVQGIGLEAIAAHEHDLIQYATERAAEVPGLRLIGTARHKGAILSFVVDRVHPHDLGTFLDHYGIAVRAGHHCAMPVMDFFRVPATARASFGMYNTREEVDLLIYALKEIIKVFS